jgi:glycosyltransferase involved in cell wall biosynthesis
MSAMYRHNFTCNPFLWDCINESAGELSVITTNIIVYNPEHLFKGFYVHMPFKEEMDVGLKTLQNPYSILNRIYFSLKANEALKTILLSRKVDLIHCFGQFAAFSTESVAKNQRIPFVFTTFNPIWSSEAACGSVKNKLVFSQEIKCLTSADKVISPSEDLINNYVKYLGVEQSHIHVAPNPIDTSLFSPPSIVLCTNKHTYTIAFIARISPFKNQLSLIKAIPEILKNVSEVKFILAGPISDYSYYNQIMAEIRREGLSSVVKVTGTLQVQELIEIYHHVDLCVILSIFEAGLPQTCLEAMSSGLPLVVSDKPFFRQYLSLEYAVFVNPNSTHEIAEAISNLITNSKKLTEMGYAARTSALNLYSFENYSKKLVSIYQNAINEKHLSVKS